MTKCNCQGSKLVLHFESTFLLCPAPYAYMNAWLSIILQFLWKSSTHSHQSKCSRFELLSIDLVPLIELWTFIRNAHLKSSLLYLWGSMTLFTIRLHKLFYGYIILYGWKLNFVVTFLFIFKKKIRIHGHPYSIYCMYQSCHDFVVGSFALQAKNKTMLI